MKGRLFCLLLALANPAFATISQVQSKAQWSGGTTSCSVTPSSKTTSGNLVVFWATWTSTSTLTANVSDTNVNTWYSAVGPTLQSATSIPTSAQLFYAKSITGTTNPVTVTFSGGSASTSGCMFVEYSGLDTNYPLDSISAGYSTSGNPTGVLDSGTVAPANANLLVFGGGTSNTGTAIAGSGFTTVQSSGGSITEQYIPSSANNVLQRATACLGTGMTCSPTTTGHWVMQMAVFRDASWTVSNTWSPVRVGNIRWADQFPGTDIGAKINNAYADCPAAGCVIQVALGNYSFSTPIVFGPGPPPKLRCGGSTNGIPISNGAVQLTYTAPSGIAITFNDGGVGASGMEGCTLIGPGTTTESAITLTKAANASSGTTVYTGTITGGGANAFAGYTFTVSGFDNNANNGTFICTASTTTTLTLSNANGVLDTHSATATYGTIGLACGIGSGTQSCIGHVFENDAITNFGIGIQLGGYLAFANTFLDDNIGDNGKNLNLTSGGGNESNKFIGGILSNQCCTPPNVEPPNCVDTSFSTGPYDMEFIGVSLDQCNVTLSGLGQRFRFIGSHIEQNVPFSSSTPYITLSATCAQCNLQLDSTDFIEDGVAGTRTEFILNNNTAFRDAIIINGGKFFTGGETVAQLVNDVPETNVTSVQNTYKANITADVNGGLSFSTLEYGSLTLGNYPVKNTQEVRDTAGCTTPATDGASCATPVTITWPVAWPDAHYSAVCTGRGITNQPGPVYIVSKGTNELVFNYQAQSNAMAAWTDVDCIGIHD
jgi:hypothetical protein